MFAFISCSEKVSDENCLPACEVTQVCINAECVDIDDTVVCLDNEVDCNDGAGCVVLADSHRATCDSCLETYGDCDNDMTNGCETKLDTDDHCGACDVVCEGSETCEDGEQGFLCQDNTSCKNGEVDCNDGAGCVVLADSNRATCGTCLETHADCDNDMTNGCEAKLDSDEHCAACENNCKANGKTKGICASVEGNLHCSITCDPEDVFDSQDFCYEDLTKEEKPGVLLKCVEDDRHKGSYVMAQVPNYCGDNVFYSCKRSADLEEYDVEIQNCSAFDNGICAPGIGCVSNEECAEEDANFCDKKVMNNCVKVGEKYYWQKTDCRKFIRAEYSAKGLDGACSKTSTTTVACEAICSDGTWAFGDCEASMSRLAFCDPYTGEARYEACENSCTTEFVDGVEKPICF